MKKLLLLFILMLMASRSWAAITFGADWATTAGVNVADSLTQTATLGSTGANSILFVVIEAESNYSTPTLDYNGVALTSLGGKSTYSGSTTMYKEVWYLNANLASGNNIHVFSGSPTTLGQTNSRAWHITYWTYGGVSGIGTSSVNATNFATSASGSPVTVAFNFTPSTATGTIIQMLPIQAANTCGSTYAAVNGTVRKTIAFTTIGAMSGALPFSDYAPGSTSLYSLSQSWNPSFCGESAYGWGIELLAAGGGPTPTPTPVSATSPPTGTMGTLGCGL